MLALGYLVLAGYHCAIEFPIRATKTIAIDAASIAFFRSIPPFKANNLIFAW
jgi:hypothetical protein